jgi:tetratricopeptide (TPR) repeat protein
LLYPDELNDASTYDAVLLFARCAQRVRPGFSLEAERTSVIRICQLVNGFPLALELAAPWSKSLTCADIVAEIQRDLEFLTSDVGDAAPQHRSMLTVFDQTWKRLSSEERVVFTRLSVFRGGFSLEAAREVAGASLPVLASLVDKSILRLGPEARYQIHELIRQYARSQLERTHEEALLTQQQFGSYYIEFVHQLEGDLIAGRQKEAIKKIKVELENIRSAWYWVIEEGNTEVIEKSVMATSLYYQYQSRYLEGLWMLEEAEASLRKQPPSIQRDLILVSVLCDLGWLRLRLGTIDRAEEDLLESIELLNRHSARPYLGNGFNPRLPFGLIASVRGDYAETARLGKEVLQESQSRSEVWNEQFALYLLTRASILQGDFDSASGYAQQTYQLAKRNLDHWFMAYCLIELGNVALALGDFAAAKGHFQASFRLREEFDDPEGMAVALSHLGGVEFKESDFAGARSSFQESRDIYRKIHDRGGLASALNGLARVALVEGEVMEARPYFLEALQVSSEIRYLSLITAILSGVAQLLLGAGEVCEAAHILAVAENHPASERETVKEARMIAR